MFFLGQQNLIYTKHLNTLMNKPTGFVSISRTIDPKTGIHYLDAIDEHKRHWVAQMAYQDDPWLVYIKPWSMMH